MLDGLASVSQAALHLGNFDVIAFESDHRIWEEAGSIISNEIEKLKARDTTIKSKLTKSLKDQELALNVMKGIKKELDDTEVLALFLISFSWND